MKKKLRFRYDANTTVEREVNYIPIRYIVAILLAVAETAAILAILVLMAKYVPYFYLMMWSTEIACIITIIAADEAPDYKIPWLLIVLVVPVAGFMLYFIFGSRKLKKKYVRRLDDMRHQKYHANTPALLQQLREDAPIIESQAKMLTRIADSNLFTNTAQQYFPLGEDMHPSLLRDLRSAERFIFMEYFIIEEGLFWNSILDILKEKAAAGVEVRLVYDDIGCMMTLPGNYDEILRIFGIDAVPFSRLKADFADTLRKCEHIDESKIHWNLRQRFIRAAVKVFAPLM